jgi:hypothetical protein
MDVFSHTLWGYGLFGHRGHPWLATLFGALPDLLSFGPLVAYRIITGTFRFGPPPHETIPAITYLAYDVTHSLLLAVVVTGLVFCRRRDIGFAMLAWPFHICLDIPFHTKEFFPTKFMWPASEWVFDGVSWGTPWVWFPNLAGLMLLLGYRMCARRLKRSRASSAIIEKD